MSYILDALKRADAERSRGAVPGLHARQLPGSGNAAPTDSQSRVWWLVAAAVALGAATAGLWLWRTPAHEANVAVPVAVAPLPTPASVPVPVAVTPVPAPPAPMPLPVVTPPAVAPTPLAPRPVTQPSPSANAKTLAKPSAAAPAATPPSAPQSAPVTPAVLPLLSELPDALRRQLPTLTITGTVYSDDPKQRLLLINNQVLPQGSQVAPEVTLEEIRPRSSVFNFRGTRFRVTH